MRNIMRRNKWIRPGLLIIFVLGLVIYGSLVESKKEGYQSTQMEKGKNPEIEQPEIVISEVKPARVEDVIYRFKDKEEIELFKQIYQTKQIVNARIAVLEDYLNQEKINLEQIDARMYVRFKFTLAPEKQYHLDETEMVLREVK